jgi:P4 family phage/plasmid primase-like protien
MIIKKELENFMNNFRIDKYDSNKVITHQTYGGSFNGKYHIPDEARNEFMELYIKTILSNEELHVLEKPKKYGPLLVDIDIEKPLDDVDDKERLYNNDLIEKLLNIYINVLEKYLIIPEKKFKFHIFEKENKTLKSSNIYKDGFHIMMPDLCINVDMRILIRKNVVELCKKEKLFDEYSNSVEKIIDSCVINSNGWFMYGSKKPDGYKYKLTKIYNDKLDILYDINEDDEPNNEDNIMKKIKLYSLTKTTYNENKQTELNNDNLTNSDIEAEISNNNYENNTFDNNIINNSINDNPNEKYSDYNIAIDLIKMISSKRADDYYEWLYLGFALNNINKELLSVWEDFSKQSDKYKIGECKIKWDTMKNNNQNHLTIRSLHHWARTDNPNLYKLYMNNILNHYIDISISKSESDIAKAFYNKYRHRFICSSIKKNTWWEFENHKWNHIEEGYTLRNELSNGFIKNYLERINEINKDILKNFNSYSQEQKEKLQKKSSDLYEIINKLKSNTFKKKILDECKSLFYEKDIENKFNEKKHLIGFKNGIYDIDQEIFRNGQPDDYVTLSTNFDYIPWSDKNPYKKKIDELFSKILTNEKVREYFLLVLSTCVAGYNKEEKFYILTGIGSNGKSVVMLLHKLALGDYYDDYDTTFLTRKKGNSSQASPDLIKLKGKRCAAGEETEENEALLLGFMKTITGGNNITGRDLFQTSREIITFIPQFKIFLLSNHLPLITSNDNGTWRRIRVIHFGSKFCDNPDPNKPNEYKLDNNLKNVLHEWAPSFMSYLIHIYITKYKKLDCIIEPSEVIKSTNDYKNDNDIYNEYVTERIIKTDSTKDIITKTSLYTDFKIWFTKNYNNEKPPNTKDIGKTIIKYIECNSKHFIKCKFNNSNDDDDDIE